MRQSSGSIAESCAQAFKHEDISLLIKAVKFSAAKQIKLADKISNIHDVAFAPPADWPYERRVDYLTWADSVVKGLRGCNEALEQLFDKTISRARSQLHGETTNLKV